MILDWISKRSEEEESKKGNSWVTNHSLLHYWPYVRFKRKTVIKCWRSRACLLIGSKNAWLQLWRLKEQVGSGTCILFQLHVWYFDLEWSILIQMRPQFNKTSSCPILLSPFHCRYNPNISLTPMPTQTNLDINRRYSESPECLQGIR